MACLIPITHLFEKSDVYIIKSLNFYLGMSKKVDTQTYLRDFFSLKFDMTAGKEKSLIKKIFCCHVSTQN